MYPASQRWPIALAGTALQICLGTVYAWSYFQGPIMESTGWSNESVTWVFSIAICCLGLAAAWGGLQLKKGRRSPRSLAVTGGILFGVGHFLAAAALAWKSWPLLFCGYGIVGGTGLGLSYVVPVATAAKWFPDKKGFITGMVVMGFGLGALLMSKLLAPMAIHAFDGNLANAFALMGVVFITLTPLAGCFMKNPPGETASHAAEKADDRVEISWGRFSLLWLLFFTNIFVGISLISFQSPLLQDLLRRSQPDIAAADLAKAGATLIACGAIFNGLGRFAWGAISDRLGQARAFSVMFAAQFAAFLLLPRTDSPLAFGSLVCLILMCYGGGFGVVPSFVLKIFGDKPMSMLYGIVLTAWSAAGIAGPKFLAWLRDHQAAPQASQTAFTVSAILMIAGLVLSVLPWLRTPRVTPP